MFQELKMMIINNNIKGLTALLSDGNGSLTKGDINKLLILSASLGHIDIAETLLKSGASINATMPLGDTSLMWAIIKNCVDMALFLIDKGVNINAQTVKGYTALFYAAKEGQMEVIKKLIESGAKVDKTNKDGETAYMIAEKAGKTQAMELLLSSTKIDTNSFVF